MCKSLGDEKTISADNTIPSNVMEQDAATTDSKDHNCPADIDLPDRPNSEGDTKIDEWE